MTVSTRRRRDTGPSATTVGKVRVRDGCCVRCGSIMDLQTHHRRPRGMGGSDRADTNSPVNLLTLCFQCHRHVEDERAEAYVRGWLVSLHHNPALVPVSIPCSRALKPSQSRRVWLTVDFRYTDVAPEVADA